MPIPSVLRTCLSDESKSRVEPMRMGLSLHLGQLRKAPDIRRPALFPRRVHLQQAANPLIARVLRGSIRRILTTANQPAAHQAAPSQTP